MVKRVFVLLLLIVASNANSQVLSQVSISSNYVKAANYGIVPDDINQFLCGLAESVYFNNAFHYGSSNEPTIGDYIVYNENYVISHPFLTDNEGFALVKLRDFNKIIQIQKSNGQIVSTYDCASSVIVNLPNTPIYFENGTCKCPTTTIGDTEVINGITYTVVDDTTIRTEIAANNVNLCTTQVTDMNQLFQSNATFNSDISFWDTSNVTNMRRMFRSASAFNQDIGSWDTSNVINMASVFWGTIFNYDISNWNVSNVTDMNNMFRESQFNRDISNWNVSNVTNMDGMFRDSQFNIDISNWDTSNVTNMRVMFVDTAGGYSIIFNQDLSGWNVNNVTNCGLFSSNVSSWTLPKPNFTNCSP